MKLWHSFLKELKLASRGYYFYIEIIMTLVFLAILMFVVPENFSSQKTEYVMFDLPKAYVENIKGDLLKDDLDKTPELVELKDGKEKIKVELYESEEKKTFLFKDEETLKRLTKKDRPLVGAKIYLDNEGKMKYRYYLQGYESEKLKNLFSIIHVKDVETLVQRNENQQVKLLEDSVEPLSDRQNMVPVILALNGSMMGMFIIAAYIFLDKKEGIIKAYAVTPSPVSRYLMSKVGIILFSNVISSSILVIPIMKLQPNYLGLYALLITSGILSSALGLFVASFYEDVMKAFGAIYILMMAMMLPIIAYMIPSWEPAWIKVLPVHPMIQGFKNCIMKSGDMGYVFMVSGIFLVAGAAIFAVANMRYKKTLTA